MTEHIGSSGSLITMLVPILVVTGLGVYLWMAPNVRIAVRKAHGRLHQYFFGPTGADGPSPTTAGPPSGSARPSGDAEKDCFDYSIFDDM